MNRQLDDGRSRIAVDAASTRLRVLHAPLNIANDPWSVSRAERALGLSSDVATIATHAFGFAADIDLAYAGFSSVKRNALKVRFMLDAARHYDIFHFHFGSSVVDYRSLGLSLIDLRYLARIGKPCLMTFHGCDVRPAIPGGCRICADGCPADVEPRLRLIRRLAAKVYVKTPDLLPAVPEARLVPQAVLLNALIARRYDGVGPIRVVHAPSHRGKKGTEHVVEACRRVGASGVDVVLDVIEGVPHDEALERMATADVAIDQLYAGWYGVFAVEAMALGVPVVCHIDSAALAAAGYGDEFPVVNADAASLERVLARMISDRRELALQGQRARQFVETYHDANAVARKLLPDYLEIAGPRDRLES